MSDESSQVFRLFGYAGTGKTTLAQHFAEDVGGNVLFAAYTGKAALVMRQRGCREATTIHKLIYQPKDKSKQHLVELEEKLRILQEKLKMGEDVLEEIVSVEDAITREKKNLKRPAFSLNVESDVRFASLVIIDECSMVDQQMGEDLLSFGTKVLVLGDPAQLPPINGTGFFASSPDVMLTEIHRQARDNPIIRMATDVRTGHRLLPGQYGESTVMKRSDPRYGPELIMGSDQVIVGKNATRRSFNARFREIKGFAGSIPVPGDKLVCLRNNHDIGILNGAIWSVEEVLGDAGDTVGLLITDGTDKVSVVAHSQPFSGDEVPLWTRRDAEEFDYGYALTCHKAQGSQWGSVVIIDESGCFRENGTKWLYTAVTRAAERVSIVV